MTTQTLDQPRPRGRPREFNRDAALDKALRVFSERGYHAASITELTDAMELTAGSVYKAFGDKRGIFLAAFDRYRQVRLDLIDARIAAVAGGRGKLHALLTVYAESSFGTIGRQGCLVVGSATELALFDREASDKVAHAFDSNEQLVLELIHLGQADGSVSGTIDAGDTARTILCLMKGMRLIGKTGRTREQMLAVAETAMKLLT
jgi:AcrR family transcriptional regulator